VTDLDGRIETVSQGTGAEERILTIAYYDHTDETTGALKGEVSTILDPSVEHDTDNVREIIIEPFGHRKIYEYNVKGQLLPPKFSSTFLFF
jgi:hypothetical protein